VVALDVVLEDSTEDGRDPRVYKDTRAASEDGQTVIGMKFVRDHVHHAAELQDFVVLSAVVGNPQYGMRAVDELEALLDPSFRSGRGLYGSRLGSRNVLHTLLDANRWFASLTTPLPGLPPDEAGMPRPEFQLPEGWPPVAGDRLL
jgi:hypothetical protein